MGTKAVSILRWAGLLPSYFLACFVTVAVTSLVYRFATSYTYFVYEVGSLSYSLDRVASFGFGSCAGLYAVYKMAPKFNEKAVLVIAWAIILLNCLGMAIGTLFLPDRSYDYLAQIGIILGSGAGLACVRKYWSNAEYGAEKSSY